MDTLAFIERYEAILYRKKIAKSQFYEDCKLSTAAVSQWRKGKTSPASTTIARIADYLGVSAEYLITGIDPEAHQKKLIPNWDELSDTHKQLINSVYSMDAATVRRLQLIVDAVLAERGK